MWWGVHHSLVRHDRGVAGGRQGARAGSWGLTQTGGGAWQTCHWSSGRGGSWCTVDKMYRVRRRRRRRRLPAWRPISWATESPPPPGKGSGEVWMNGTARFVCSPDEGGASCSRHGGSGAAAGAACVPTQLSSSTQPPCSKALCLAQAAMCWKYQAVFIASPVSHDINPPKVVASSLIHGQWLVPFKGIQMDYCYYF